jgi:hypothetical protein
VTHAPLCCLSHNRDVLSRHAAGHTRPLNARETRNHHSSLALPQHAHASRSRSVAPLCTRQPNRKPARQTRQNSHRTVSPPAHIQCAHRRVGTPTQPAHATDTRRSRTRDSAVPRETEQILHGPRDARRTGRQLADPEEAPAVHREAQRGAQSGIR